MFSYRLLSYIRGDGDTPRVKFQLDEPRDLGFGFLTAGATWEMPLRILGIDTPDHEAGRPLAGQAADLVAAFTEKTVNAWIAAADSGPIPFVESKEWDKYGGRILGDISYGTQSLSKLLFLSDYAHRFTGKVKKTPWTDDELEMIVSTLGVLPTSRQHPELPRHNPKE